MRSSGGSVPDKGSGCCSNKEEEVCMTNVNCVICVQMHAESCAGSKVKRSIK